MAEVFTQAHIWAIEKTGRTSRMSVNKRGLDVGYTTQVLYTRNLFILLKLLQLKRRCPEQRVDCALTTVSRSLTLNLTIKN